MIRAGCVGGKPVLESSVRGIAIYLDTFAIKSLARGDASLRQRFIAALYDGADLLFSIANAAEVSGAQGRSCQAIRALLDDLGPNWYPIEMVPQIVMQREAEGLPSSKCCVADELLRAFFSNRTCENLPGSGKVIDLSEGFFRLGAFVDWLTPQRDEHLRRSRELDRVLIEKIPLLRAKHKQNPGWLESAMPQVQFDAARPATFTFVGLMRDLICDAGYQMKKGDGIDFCHAVMATAFSTIATLDKQWKRRVLSLPNLNRIPHIYYEPELGAMIDAVEAGLAELKR